MNEQTNKFFEWLVSSECPGQRTKARKAALLLLLLTFRGLLSSWQQESTKDMLWNGGWVCKIKKRK
jgi:hypothetical protein